MAVQRITFAARWKEKDLDQIKQRAQAWDLSASEYVRRCALGEQLDPSVVDKRLDELEQRMKLLEERSEAASW